MISVIIPLYNAAATIDKALHSVVSQTVGEFEIIVINDGSTDHSLERVNIFRQNHPGTRIMIVDKKHEGVSVARNIGLHIANGEYIAFLDADDEWFSDKTRKQLNILSVENDIAFIGCMPNTFLKKKLRNRHGIQKRIKAEELLFNNFFITSSVLMKRYVFETVGFFEPGKLYGEDRHYFLRVANRFSCLLIHEPLVVYGNGKRGFGQRGLSRNLLQMEIAEIRNIVFAHKVLGLPLFKCSQAIAFSVLKFFRRVFISLPDIIFS